MNINNEKLNRFITLLKSIFELDKTDLDFGIYRIINIRKDEITQFLTDGLPKKVKEALEGYTLDKKWVNARIKEIEKQAHDQEIEITDNQLLYEEYSELKSLLMHGIDFESLENDVYSYLYSFFNRYYDEGDFISKRRYKEGVYAIPYEGEEVKLHWANADQYYIKTTENFRDYTFISQDKKIHFKLMEATTEINNNKETNNSKREFMLFNAESDSYRSESNDEQSISKNKEIKTIEEINGELFIRFIYNIPEDKKRKYFEENLTTIQDTILKDFPAWRHCLTNISLDKKEMKTLLEKHLKAYISKNTFDYFIHKDLRKFLTRELDFFIKSEVIHLDDLDTTSERRANSYLAKVRALKRVGKIIIDFLAQIEDFQKKLWLKIKFVVETNWCITLDQIDETFYPDIVSNKAQIKEWIDMYAINEIKSNLTDVGFSDPLTIDFLLQNKNLLLDTKHFSNVFKDRLIASIDNLDQQTNGLMIHSENFQALGLLQERYRDKVKCVYIDPPYNAQSSEIMYKNTYKHSSWLSLIYDRILKGSRLLIDDFCHIIAIDEVEQEVLGQVISKIFPNNKKVCIPIVHNPRGQQGKNVSYIHEFAYIIYPSDNKKYISDIKRSEIDSRSLRDSGTESDRKDAATCFYPFFVKDGIIIGVGEVPEDSYHPKCGNLLRDDGIMEIYPVDDNGNEKKWRYSVNTISKILTKLEVKLGRNSYQIIFNQDLGVIKSLWAGAKYDASEYGTKLLQDILSIDIAALFTYPKSFFTVFESLFFSTNLSSTILDYFAGSGTTGHAVLNLNRLDGGSRKYILVEMGEYFGTVTLPRMKKVIYASEWKEGKPKSRDSGVSQILKYMKLESYEDTLSNIELKEEVHGLQEYFGEDYMINYMFDLESQESILDLDAFAQPFCYKLKIAENNETKVKEIDLVETFNYLIGISVVRQMAVVYFTAYLDVNGDYENAVRLVSERRDNASALSLSQQDSSGVYAFKQIEGKLPDGRRALVIWRTISEDILQSNAALDAYFTKNRINPLDREYDVIYVNGDNNLENLRLDDESWKVNRIESVFKSKMFEGTD